MSLRIKYGVIFVLLAILATTLNINNASALANAGTISGIQIIATIKGLEAGDQAILDISTEGKMLHEDAIISKSVVGEDKVINVTLSAPLKDGSYQVTIDATDKYFREPRGYFFTLRDSKIYNPDNRTIAFELIPPSARDYEPSRNSFHFAPVSKVVSPPAIAEVGTRPIRSEHLRDLASPKKDPIPKPGENAILGTKYYVNFGTTVENQGLFGILVPVNTGVTHPSPPSGNDFVVGHVYSQNTSGGQIEAGWLDCSWKDDYRYIYTYNSVDNYFKYHGTVSDYSYLNVFTQIISGTTWGVYWWNGSTWEELENKNIGCSSANYTFIGGEIEIASGSPPSLPQSNIVNAQLYFSNSNSWDTWDTDYYTVPFDYSPYHKHVTSYYYDWYMHTN